MELIFTFSKTCLWDNIKRKNKTKTAIPLNTPHQKAQIRSVGLSDSSFAPGDSLCLHNVAPSVWKRETPINSK